MAKIKYRESVLKAISEFDTLGRNRFLKQYGFKPSRTYFLLHAGKQYDSKAIVAVAFGYENPSCGPLKSGDFSGGYVTVKRWLEKLGFAVVSKKVTDD